MLLLAKLASFFFDGWGKLALGAGAVLSLVVWWRLELVEARREGASHVVIQANEQAGEIARSIRNAGERAADAADPVGRLRKHYCSNC